MGKPLPPGFNPEDPAQRAAFNATNRQNVVQRAEMVAAEAERNGGYKPLQVGRETGSASPSTVRTNVTVNDDFSAASSGQQTSATAPSPAPEQRRTASTSVDAYNRDKPPEQKI